MILTVFGGVSSGLTAQDKSPISETSGFQVLTFAASWAALAAAASASSACFSASPAFVVAAAALKAAVSRLALAAWALDAASPALVFSVPALVAAASWLALAALALSSAAVFAASASVSDAWALSAAFWASTFAVWASLFALTACPLAAVSYTHLDVYKRQLFALTWNDINFDTQTIMINKSYSYTKGDTDTYTAQTGPTKCNEIRRNKLPVVLVNILKEHKIKQKCELAEYGVIQTDEILVFSTCIGTHLDASNVYKKLKQVYLDLGINEEGSAYNKNFHDLRHTYATRNFEEGVEPLVISKLLGHADINTTLKTYIHVLNLSLIHI